MLVLCVPAQPRNWRFIAHMPDEILAALLAALFRCELSAQQLLMLHSQIPSQMAEDFAEKKVDGESEEVGSLGDLYLGHSINISEPRFCGLGTVTAALATRFQLGLPSALRQLPVRILLTVRHPVDVVVARLHAKWVRGAPAWPECTLSTIRSCAQQLCGSMEQMLRTLDSRKAEGVGDELLRILRWETFSRRRSIQASNGGVVQCSSAVSRSCSRCAWQVALHAFATVRLAGAALPGWPCCGCPMRAAECRNA